MGHWLTIAVCLVIFSTSAPAAAALPPSQLMEARLKQARQARKPTQASVKVTIVGDGVAEFRGDVKLVTDSSITLRASDEKALQINAESGSKTGPGDVLGWLVMSSQIVDVLGSIGEFRRGESSVEVLGDEFGYRYGSSPSLTVARDLAKVLRVDWQTGGNKLSARMVFDDKVAWPTTVSVLRNGRPWLRMDVVFGPQK